MSLPIEIVLAVVREGAGRWDTRRIDIELGLRGVVIDHGILRDMVLLSEQGLIERVASDRSGTGPYWRLTQEGERVLAVGLRPDGDEEMPCD